MKTIKVKASSEDPFHCKATCFICLKPLSQPNRENKSLNFLFNYLKIKDQIESVVCETCDKNLAKLAKLCETLLKVSLEMDNVLDSIQSAIQRTKYYHPEPAQFNSVRKSVMRKCKQEMLNPRPEILLQRIKLPNLPKTSPTCSKCRKVYKTKKGLRRHINAVHLRLRPHKCDLCNKSFLDPYLLRRHKSSAHNLKQNIPKVFSCKKCGNTFSTLQCLKTHERWIHTEKRFQCSACNIKFKCRNNLETHISSFHQKQMEHPDLPLPQRLERSQIIEYPEGSSNQQGLFKCTTCLKEFHYASSLRRHIRAAHLLLKPHKCDICGKSFAIHSELRLHNATPCKPKRQVLTPKIFSCEKCDKAFNKLQFLKSHELNVHSKDRLKFECKICYQKFQISSQLEVHISSVHWKKRHSCKVKGCGKTYSRYSGLVVHYKLKHPDISQKSFKNENNSISLKKSSCKTFNYLKCNICYKKFNHRNNLEIHISSLHANEKNQIYNDKLENQKKAHEPPNLTECKLCGMKFKSVDIYRKHKRVVHKLKRFFCVDGGYSSAYKFNLDTHIERCHQINPELGIQRGEREARSLNDCTPILDKNNFKGDQKLKNGLSDTSENPATPIVAEISNISFETKLENVDILLPDVDYIQLAQ